MFFREFARVGLRYSALVNILLNEVKGKVVLQNSGNDLIWRFLGAVELADEGGDDQVTLDSSVSESIFFDVIPSAT